MAIGVIKLDFDRDVIARHDHLDAFGQLHVAGHVRGAEVELGTVVVEERSMTAAFFLAQHVDFSLELLVGLDGTGLGKTWPRSTSSFLMPRRSTPTLSPARASSRSLRNISMSVTVGLGGVA